MARNSVGASLAVLLLVLVPILFVWYVEMSLVANGVSSESMIEVAVLSQWVDGNRAYHIGMYALFTTCWGTALWMLYRVVGE